MSEIRPEVTAGPMDRKLSPANSEAIDLGFVFGVVAVFCAKAGLNDRNSKVKQCSRIFMWFVDLNCECSDCPVFEFLIII